MFEDRWNQFKVNFHIKVLKEEYFVGPLSDLYYHHDMNTYLGIDGRVVGKFRSQLATVRKLNEIHNPGSKNIALSMVRHIEGSPYRIVHYCVKPKHIKLFVRATDVEKEIAIILASIPKRHTSYVAPWLAPSPRTPVLNATLNFTVPSRFKAVMRRLFEEQKKGNLFLGDIRAMVGNKPIAKSTILNMLVKHNR